MLGRNKKKREIIWIRIWKKREKIWLFRIKEIEQGKRLGRNRKDSGR